MAADTSSAPAAATSVVGMAAARLPALTAEPIRVTSAAAVSNASGATCTNDITTPGLSRTRHDGARRQKRRRIDENRTAYTSPIESFTGGAAPLLSSRPIRKTRSRESPRDTAGY